MVIVMLTVYLAMLKNQYVPKTPYPSIDIYPSSIDIFLKHLPRSFQNTLTIETGISHFHKMVIMVMKVFCKNKKPKIIQYRSTKTLLIRYFRVN